MRENLLSQNNSKTGVIIAVTNQKGGTGKTTVTMNLGVALVKMGYKVLLMDNDGQTNLTTGLIVREEKYKKRNIGSILENILVGKQFKLSRMIIHTKYVDIIAGCRTLFTFKEDFQNREDRNTVYRSLLSTIRHKYDFILVDCPPVAGLENAQAYTAADSILIVSEPSMYSLDGIVDAIKIVSDARIETNSNLNVLGVVINKVHIGRTEDKGYVEEIKSSCNGYVHVFENMIPESAAIARCPSLGKSIFQHRSKSKAAVAFSKLAEEIVMEVAKYA